MKDRRRHFKTVLKKMCKNENKYWSTIVAYNRWIISAFRCPSRKWSKIVLKFFPGDFITIVKKIARVLKKEKTLVKKVEKALPFVREESDYLSSLLSK